MINLRMATMYQRQSAFWYAEARYWLSIEQMGWAKVFQSRGRFWAQRSRQLQGIE